VDLAAIVVAGRKIASISLVARDAFVVVQEVAAPVENGPPSVDFDCLRMMRGVAVDHIDAGHIDELVSQGDLLLFDLVAPVVTPVNGSHDDVSLSPAGLYPSRNVKGDLG
jgi:hypothetical protein